MLVIGTGTTATSVASVAEVPPCLSAQPMGALRDYIAKDPVTERFAVVNFPVREDNPFRIDVEATARLLEQVDPELIVFGKSMVIHREPVAEIRALVAGRKDPPLLMYDMAHVLGLIGPHFQEPFRDGADIVTGSTHKTYFGTQRGVIGMNAEEDTPRFALWNAVRRRAFPGMTSNHHLGSLLGLLMAAIEMNAFKDECQPQVIANAKAFARALEAEGLDVAGDPAIDFTETHQVIVRVGRTLRHSAEVDYLSDRVTMTMMLVRGPCGSMSSLGEPETAFVRTVGRSSCRLSPGC
jgi:aminomethyltransferase